jgi:hypothetical protein
LGVLARYLENGYDEIILGSATCHPRGVQSVEGQDPLLPNTSRSNGNPGINVGRMPFGEDIAATRRVDIFTPTDQLQHY